MSISRLIRWGGLTGAAGGVLWVVLLALYATLPTAAPGELRPGENLVMLAAPLLTVGIVALYGHQRRRARWFGRVAFTVGCAGAVAMLIARLLVDFADVPESWFGASFVAFYAGLLLFALGTLLIGEAPAPAAALLLASTAVLPLVRFEDARAWTAAPFGVAWVWLGWAVWRGRRPLRPRPIPLTRTVSLIIGALRPADHTN